MPYNFTTEWMKGSSNQGPNALSRSPVFDPLPEDLLAEKDVDDAPGVTCAEIQSVTTQGESSVRIEELCQHCKDDEECQTLKKYMLQGFPMHCHDLPEILCRRY